MYISGIYRQAKNTVHLFGLIFKIDNPINKWNLYKNRHCQESYIISVSKGGVFFMHSLKNDKIRPNNYQELFKMLEHFFHNINDENISIYSVSYSVDNKTPKLEFLLESNGYNFLLIFLYKENKWILDAGTLVENWYSIGQ